MAAPNIRKSASTGRIRKRGGGKHVRTTWEALVVNTAGSGMVYGNLAVRGSNVDGSASVDLSLGIYDASQADIFYLGKTIPVPADQAVVFSDKTDQINLEEGDALYGVASVTLDGDILYGYDEMDETTS